MNYTQPRIRLQNWEEAPVLQLARMDKWKTLRAFPLQPIGKSLDWQPLSYVIVQWEWEETEVNAELFYKD